MWVTPTQLVGRQDMSTCLHRSAYGVASGHTPSGVLLAYATTISIHPAYGAQDGCGSGLIAYRMVSYYAISTSHVSYQTSQTSLLSYPLGLGCTILVTVYYRARGYSGKREIGPKHPYLGAKTPLFTLRRVAISLSCRFPVAPYDPISVPLQDYYSTVTVPVTAHGMPCIYLSVVIERLMVMRSVNP